MKAHATSKRQRRLRAPERRRIILEQAMELFSNQGFDGVSIDEIAAASGITKPVLYDHFTSKEDLYLQICREIRDRLLRSGGQGIVPAQTLSARIRAGVEAFFVFAETNPAAIRILLSPPRNPAKLYRAIVLVQDQATLRIMKMLLAAGVSTPRGAHATQELAVQVEFIKRGLHALGQWRVEHPAVSRNVIVDAIAKMIRSGLATR
jgi:AcrR family transcriptional regulator